MRAENLDTATRVAASQRRKRAGADLAARLAQADRAAKAAGLRPALSNTLYRGTEVAEGKR